MSRFRKLKIHSKFRTRRWDNTTVPEIRLEGRWLEELGFEEGGQVKIEQQRHRLTITLHQEEKEK
jgi:toxic protein SymE